MIRFFQQMIAGYGTLRRETDRRRTGIVALVGIILVGASLLLSAHGVAAQINQRAPLSRARQTATALPHSGRTSVLSVSEVADTFRAAGLPVNDLRQQPTGLTSPSGPPATEREAWAFSIPTVAPSGGRLLLFADDESLQKKAAWYVQSGTGATITVHGNAILWLDPALAPAEVARYRQALEALS